MRFLGRLTCFFRGHDDTVEQALFSPTTRLSCRRCLRTRDIQVIAAPVGTISSELVHEKGQIFRRYWCEGRNILTVRFSRKQLIEEGRKMLNGAASLGTLLHSTQSDPEAAQSQPKQKAG